MYSKHLWQGTEKKCHMKKRKSLTLFNVLERKRDGTNKSMRMSVQMPSKIIYIQGGYKLTNCIRWGNAVILCDRCKRKKICSSIRHTSHIPTFRHEQICTYATRENNSGDDRQTWRKIKNKYIWYNKQVNPILYVQLKMALYRTL